MHTKLLTAALCAVAPLAAAAPATARIIEVGDAAEDATPSCPTNPCQAVSRTTGYQAKVGEQRGLFTVPEDGKIVAWTITLGRPGRVQERFFADNYGGAASAGITVIRPGRRLYARTVVSSPIEQLKPYFGQTVQFPLDRALTVKKGWVVALTVPTWAPALAINLPSTTSWRASRTNRPRDKCLDTEAQTALTRVGTLTRFLCLYKTARLTYSATLITEPDPDADQPAEQPGN